jgi:hypothetical protein
MNRFKFIVSLILPQYYPTIILEQAALPYGSPVSYDVNCHNSTTPISTNLSMSSHSIFT